MKKFIALALSLALVFSLVACGDGEEEETAKTYKTGLGILVEGSGSDRTREKNGKVQIDTTIMVVTFDEEDKVVSATLDVAQQSAPIDAQGKVAGEVDLRTKVDKGDDYGMRGVSGIGKEVGEQMAAFTDWMVGKTYDEITGMALKARDEEHDQVPDVEELKSSVTVDVGAYLEAFKKAHDNAVETTGAVAKTGLGINISESHKDAAADANGQVQINTNVVGAAFDADGKVVAATIDVAQNKMQFDAKGRIVGEFDARTKVEKGDDYGMRGVSEIGKEVGEQYAALGQWMIGKTAEEITAMPTTQRDEEHNAVPDVEELKSSVTITVADYLDALKEAWEKAK